MLHLFYSSEPVIRLACQILLKSLPPLKLHDWIRPWTEKDEVSQIQQTSVLFLSQCLTLLLLHVIIPQFCHNFLPHRKDLSLPHLRMCSLTF